MSADLRLASDLTATLVAMYGDLETRLARDMARRLASGDPDTPDWAAAKLAALGTLRRHAAAVLERLNGPAQARVSQLLILAYARGASEALREMQRLGHPHRDHGRLIALLARILGLARRRDAKAQLELDRALRDLPGAESINRLVWSLTSKLSGTHLRILRWAEDAYREVIATATVPMLAGIQTRRQATRIAWERLISHGVTGFVDRSGRRWRLESYVEMAVRTTAAHAAVQAHLDILADDGVGYVIVSDSPQECHLCRPWEGRVLSIAPGPAGTVQMEHGTRDGQMVDVDVAGSVATAVAAGLMHPNCTHALSAYLPGVTRIPQATANPEGAKARQELRRLEREVRAWKRVEAAALDDEQAADARRNIRKWQARIRDHVESTGLIRQRHREQIPTH